MPIRLKDKQMNNKGQKDKNADSRYIGSFYTYSIRTRIKTNGFKPSRCLFLAFRHIPLEQGLIPRPSKISWRYTSFTHIPLEQGLRQHAQRYAAPIITFTHIPLEQGLRLNSCRFYCRENNFYTYSIRTRIKTNNGESRR